MDKALYERQMAKSRVSVRSALVVGSTEDLVLTDVQPEPPVDGGDLRFDRAFVGQEDARRAAFNDGGCNGRGLDVGEALGSEDDAGVLLPQSLQPFLELLGEGRTVQHQPRSEEHTSELQSLMRISYAVFCLKK